MLERLVEYWLTSVGELGYQVPFTQLLMAEGHRVLQGPVHHPFEHGKDIITIDPRKRLSAFQLKGPDEISDLKGLERYQGQLDALAMAAISHPSIGAGRLPDRVYVVTNGVLRPEVRDRLNQISAGNVARRLPPLEFIERDHLVSRLLAVHGRYLPSEPASFRRLVELYSDDGLGPLPTQRLLSFLEESLPFTGATSPTGVQRAIGSAALLTAYALRGWEASANHLAVAQGWLVYALVVLRLAEEQSAPPERWEPSFALAFGAARAALERLLAEASERDDLLVPDLAEGAFYGTRVLLVCGYGSALLLAERMLGEPESSRPALTKLLRREVKYARVLGESGGPLLFAIASALSLLESSLVGEAVIERYARGLLLRNQPGAKGALADPYHPIDEVLARSLELDNGEQLSDERFDGRAFTARAAIEWLTRRLRRRSVASLWASYTLLVTCEFVPSSPARLLTLGDDDGRLEMRMPKLPGSWRDLRTEALQLDKADVPAVLWRHPEMLPFLPLLLPPRLTASLVRVIDYLLFPSGDYVIRDSVGQEGSEPAPRQKRPSRPASSRSVPADDGRAKADPKPAKAPTRERK